MEKIVNISELKQRIGIANSNISLLGYYSAGDGGGGEFYWDSTSTETDNGGTIISVSTIGVGRWKRVLKNKIDVKWFGAKGDGTTNDTSFLQNAHTASITNNIELFFSKGVYIVSPNIIFDDEDASYLTYAVFLMQSNLKVNGENATIKLIDNFSTDALVKSYGIFCTNQTLSNVSIRNIIFDMNGDNNKISPLRPTTYSYLNQSPILVSGTPSGVAAKIDNCLIEKCVFKNNAGVCDIVVAQSNSLGTVLGKNWIIKDNYFYNNGLDTSDHTCVFAWADDVQFLNNTIENITDFGTVGKTGGNTGYEIHGKNHKLIGNTFRKYYRGIWVSSNLTSITENSIIENNVFETSFYGVSFFRTTSNLTTIKNTTIQGNAFSFVNTPTFSGMPQIKECINITCEYNVSDIYVLNNIAKSTETSVGTAFIGISPQTVAGETYDNIIVKNNSTVGITIGALIRTNAVNGLGLVELSGNNFVNPLKSPSFTTSFGVFLDPVTAIKTLILNENNVIDTRSTSLTNYGIYIQPGSINTLFYKKNIVKNVINLDYYENGLTVTERLGVLEKITYTPIIASSSPITLGNGSIDATYSIYDNQVFYNIKLIIGSTTVIPGGTITITTPFVAAISGRTYLGNYRIFYSGLTKFITGVCLLDGTSNSLVLVANDNTFVTSTIPYTLGSGDSLVCQITFNI